jgi:hypothetical protein
LIRVILVPGARLLVNSLGKTREIDTKALIATGSTCMVPIVREFGCPLLVVKRAFVLVTVYSDTDRSLLLEIRDIPSVVQVDMVLGAFDAVVTVEAEDERRVHEAVLRISRIPGVKEAKPLMEIELSPQRPRPTPTST